jgi:formate hydrogenlyase transcriptional activator
MSSADRRETIGAPVYRLHTWPRQYGLVLVAVIAAGLARYGLDVALGFTQPFVLFYPVIMLVALLGGAGPGLFATLLSSAIAEYFFMEPLNSFAAKSPRDVVGLLLFAAMGMITSWLGDLFRRRAKRLQEFEKAVEGLEEMIVVVDRDYRFVIANRAFLNYRRIRREDLIGSPMEEVLSPGVFETTVKEKLDECFRGKTVQFELRCTYPTLGERDIWVSYFPIEGPGGIDRVANVLRDVTDQKKSEQSLKLFRTLIDQSNDAVEVVDPATLLFLDVNEKACKDLGYSREELLTMTVFDINPDLDECTRTKVVERLRESGFVVQQGLHRRKDGSTFPIETSLRWVELDRSYVVAVTRDITERKKADEALAASERRFRAVYERAPVGIALVDPGSGRFLEVNPKFCEILGRREEEVLTLDFPSVTHSEDVAENLLRRTELAEGKSTGFELEKRYVRPDGELVWANVSVAQMVREEEPRRANLVMAQDITKRKRAENELQASEMHFRVLVEQASDGIFIADAQGKYVDVNSAGAEMLGYTREEMLQLSIPDIVVEEETPRITPEVARIAAGATVLSEWKFRRKDGSTFPGEVCGKQLPDGRLQGILRDISGRRAAEEAMRRNEERFRVALKDSPITVFNQDDDLRYTWIYNPQLQWQGEVAGKTDAEIFGPKKAARLIELKRRVLKTGVALREEVAIPNEGKSHAFDLTIEPLLDAGGSVIGITGAAIDIARLREMTDRLQDAKDKLVQEKSYLENEIQTELGFEEIIGQSPALREVLKDVRVVAPTDSTVLLLGETGTGKELVARSVHRLSARRDKTFIKLNCAAVPSGLLESELFGHEKGAFTGAVSQKVGRIELADKGTLFLDEIGELPLELQPKLLRVLQDREFERLGGVRTLRVDVRIISATNRDLHQDIADKNFREDLFYRLNVFPISLPALRERRDDIPILVHHFVGKHSARMGKRIDVIPQETVKVLQNWSWPGNIRELENMIERMVILTKGRALAAPPAGLDVPQDVGDESLTEMEREHIIRVLRETRGVLSGTDGAASRLGVKRTTLQSMIKRHGIELQDYRRGNGTFGAS